MGHSRFAVLVRFRDSASSAPRTSLTFSLSLNIHFSNLELLFPFYFVSTISLSLSGSNPKDTCITGFHGSASESFPFFNSRLSPLPPSLSNFRAFLLPLLLARPLSRTIFFTFSRHAATHTLYISYALLYLSLSSLSLCLFIFLGNKKKNVKALKTN